MVDDAQKQAQAARENPDALPLIAGPQDYIPVDAALPSMRQLRPGRARQDGQAEPRHLPEEGRARLRLHPEDLPDDLQRQLEGAVRLLPVRRGRLHPDLPHQGRRRLGLGGHHRRQGHLARSTPTQLTEVAADKALEEPEAARDRAGPLHRHPRAARQRAVPVADDGPLQRAHRRGPGRQLLQRQAAGHDQGRREAVQRRGHDQERHRQPVLRQSPIGTDGTGRASR